MKSKQPIACHLLLGICALHVLKKDEKESFFSAPWHEILLLINAKDQLYMRAKRSVALCLLPGV